MNFWKYHEEIKEYFDFKKSVQFQIEKWEKFQLDKENIPMRKRKIFQIDKGKHSN